MKISRPKKAVRYIALGLDKLRASEPCESREASVKKKEKGNTGKNCKFTDEVLSTHYTD